MEDFARPKHRNSLTSTKKIVFPFSVVFTISFVVLFVAANLLIEHEQQQAAHYISPLATPIQETYDTIKETFFSSPLKARIESIIQDKQGTYAFVIKNMKTGEIYTLNENKQFAAASLYKLWLVGTTFQQIEKGTLKENAVVQQNVETLNAMFDIATESAELKEGNVAMTIMDAVRRSIIISNNTAALLLTTQVRVSNMKIFLQTYNMKKSNTKTVPETTASDIALFYEKLYKKELVSTKASNELIAILREQQITDRIPKYLPKNISVAHKTGELYGFKHDAGIVYTPKGDYIIVALSETNNPKNAAETIATVSKEVYDYFNQQN